MNRIRRWLQKRREERAVRDLERWLKLAGFSATPWQIQILRQIQRNITKGQRR